MTPPRHNVNPPLAVAFDGWSDSLRRDLLQFKPTSLELCGEWLDLSVFAGFASSITTLQLSGRHSDGRVLSLRGLSSFVNLHHLYISSKVPPSALADLPASVASIDFAWQPEAAIWLTSPSLQKAHIRAFPGKSLEDLVIGPNLMELSLLTPKIESLALPTGRIALEAISIARARSLVTLDGCEDSAMHALRVNEARRLADIRAVARLRNLKELQLVDISTSVNLAPIIESKSLAKVHVAGTGVPTLPWPQLLSLSTIRKAAGTWDPTKCSEEQIRSAPGLGLRIARFEPIGSRGNRPLLVEVEPSCTID